MKQSTPSHDAIAKVILHNCKLKGEVPSLPAQPWFLQHPVSERVSALLLQLLQDSNHTSVLFASSASYQVLALMHANDSYSDTQYRIQEEERAVKDALSTIDPYSSSTSSSAQFKLVYLGQAGPLSAELRIKDVSYFLSLGSTVNAELEQGDIVHLLVRQGATMLGEEVIDLDPPNYSAYQLVAAQSFTFAKETIVAGVQVWLELTLFLSPQAKARLLNSKLLRLQYDLKVKNDSSNDNADLLRALELRVTGHKVKSTMKTNLYHQIMPKLERSCECCSLV
jgi:hypothetical protein